MGQRLSQVSNIALKKFCGGSIRLGTQPITTGWMRIHPTLLMGSVMAVTGEEVVQTITVGGELWTVGHVVDYLRRSNAELSLYLEGPLFGENSATEKFWNAVFGDREEDAVRLRDPRKMLHVNETIDLRPLWNKVSAMLHPSSPVAKTLQGAA